MKRGKTVTTLSNVDMALDHAFYCVNCDVVTSSSSRCMRCSGAVVPLTRWFTRTEEAPLSDTAPAPTCVTYVVKTGFEDEEDGAVSCAEIPNFHHAFLTQEAAIAELSRYVVNDDGKLRPSNHPLFSRLSGVVSVLESVHYKDSPRYWCIVQVMPKIKLQTALTS